MEYVTAIIATSHVDSHGDRLTVDALKSMVDQINSQYIPMIVEHDPRCPPLGRITSARLVRSDDGEYAVETTTQFFDAGEEPKLDVTGRSMPVRQVNDDFLHLVDDRSFASPEDQALLEELRNLISGKQETEVKKASDPISILQIAGMFPAGRIATGLLNKVGSDRWDTFKKKLSAIVKKKGQERGECLLIFRFVLLPEPGPVSIEIILTNPSGADINLFLGQGLRDLDQATPSLLLKSKDLSKIVTRYSEGKLTVSFAVRKDAVPVYFKL